MNQTAQNLWGWILDNLFPPAVLFGPALILFTLMVYTPDLEKALGRDVRGTVVSVSGEQGYTTGGKPHMRHVASRYWVRMAVEGHPGVYADFAVSNPNTADDWRSWVGTGATTSVPHDGRVGLGYRVNGFWFYGVFVGVALFGLSYMGFLLWCVQEAFRPAYTKTAP